MSVARAAPLAGRAVVITRPLEQSHALAGIIRRHGGRAIVFPTIEISPPADPGALNDMIDRLDTFDIAVFTSPVAVERAMSAIVARRTLPTALTFAAIGAASARALIARGASRVIAPKRGADSEALLAMPELEQVTGKHVVIFRGDGGRELIAQTLSARGARVEYAQAYRRSRPSADTTPLIEAWQRGELAAFIVTSSEGLRNLCDMLDERGRQLLAATPVFVPHLRIAQVARTLDLAVVETASGDEEMVDALIEHLSR